MVRSSRTQRRCVASNATVATAPSRPCDGHRRWLVEEQERLQRLVRTIDRTIEGITDGGEMVAEAMFEGFEHNRYAAEARERWGDEAVDAPYVTGWSPADADNARTGYERVHEGLTPLLDRARREPGEALLPDGLPQSRHLAEVRVRDLVRRPPRT